MLNEYGIEEEGIPAIAYFAFWAFGTFVVSTLFWAKDRIKGIPKQVAAGRVMTICASNFIACFIAIFIWLALFGALIPFAVHLGIIYESTVEGVLGETGHLIIGLAILNASAFYMHFEDDSNITRTLYWDGYKFVDEDGIEYREVD